jgi:ABC-2 type transport system permease protein
MTAPFARTAAMARLTRVELAKLRSTGLPWVLLAASTALTLLVAILRATRSGTSGNARLAAGPLNTAHGLSAVLASPDYALILAMVLGAVIASGEFRYRTATWTYLAVPARARVLTAKCAAALAAGGLFGLAASASNTAIGLSFVAARGYNLALGAATIIRYAAGETLGCGLLAALGVATGTLIRSQVAAVITVFAWSFLIEGILGALTASAAAYLPYQAAISLAGAPLTGGGTPLPFAAAAAVIAAAAVVAAAAAARITLPKDIA